MTAAAPSRRLLAVVAAGALALLGSFILSPVRAFDGLLVAGVMTMGLAIGAGLFIAIRHLTGAGWCVSLERVPEAMLRTLPLAMGLIAVALAGLPLLYEWAHAGAMDHDPILATKKWWLSPVFFLGRAAVVLGGFYWLSGRLLAARTGEGRRRIAAAYTVFFALGTSILAFDWLMSLSPHWFSSLFSGYIFAGVFQSALAGLVLGAIFFRRSGPLRPVVRDDHLADLGRLLFGFSVFWGYLWFCQYLLIWYGNLPEETPWYVARTAGGWAPVFWVVPIVNFVLPFGLLMSRGAKRSEGRLLLVAAIVLFGRWLDLVTTTGPVHHPEGPSIGPAEVLVPAAAMAALWILFKRSFAARDPFPAEDPLLQESLRHHA